MNFFDNPVDRKKLEEHFKALHESLKCGGSETAAKALVKLLSKK